MKCEILALYDVDNNYLSRVFLAKIHLHVMSFKNINKRNK